MESFAEAGLWIDLMEQGAEIARNHPNDRELWKVWMGIVQELEAKFASSHRPAAGGRWRTTEGFFSRLQGIPLVTVDRSRELERVYPNQED